MATNDKYNEVVMKIGESGRRKLPHNTRGANMQTSSNIVGINSTKSNLGSK